MREFFNFQIYVSNAKQPLKQQICYCSLSTKRRPTNTCYPSFELFQSKSAIPKKIAYRRRSVITRNVLTEKFEISRLISPRGDNSTNISKTRGEKLRNVVFGERAGAAFHFLASAANSIIN